MRAPQELPGSPPHPSLSPRKRGERVNFQERVYFRECFVHHATAAAGLGARTPSRWQIATSRSARFKV